jgi:hypothetical protein
MLSIIEARDVRTTGKDAIQIILLRIVVLDDEGDQQVDELLHLPDLLAEVLDLPRQVGLGQGDPLLYSLPVSRIVSTKP